METITEEHPTVSAPGAGAAAGPEDVPTEQVPAHVPVYTWNLAGHRAAHGPSGTANRHTFGGLSDAAFRMVPLLEAADDTKWPWAP